VAGCSSGQEAYSLAILLYEEKLYSKCRIYATDLNEKALDIAKTGIFRLSVMQEYTKNYQEAGGQESFSKYYISSDESAIFKAFLKKNILFAAHNLVSDASFNEFHLILCRNVLIYFNRPLQNRVHALLYESLAPSGYLGLGRSESIHSLPCRKNYKMICSKQILRKID
jgi:chemotaxis protein methyltransferase CheR